MKTIVISFGSATIAMKAKKILNRNSIGARLIKPDLIKSKIGCSHGIEIDEVKFYDAVILLKGAEIDYFI